MQLIPNLNADPKALAASYQAAAPFPHIVIDNLFDDALLRQILGVFPKAGDMPWRSFDSETEKKLGYWHTNTLAPVIWDFLQAMNAPPMLDFLEQLTGIDGLIPDPYFGGAGLHQILPGGFLKVHVDFNIHPKMKLDRRLNMLVYLNEDWQDAWGGPLELWDRDISRCYEKIAPVFNRTVVFSTTDWSYHGHPHPLSCPEGESRKSLSFYYYTNGRPESERSPEHDTIFRNTPDTDIVINNNQDET